MTVNELIIELSRSGSFGAGRLASAVEIYERMLKEKAKVFFGLAGAMVPAGMKRVIVDLMRNRMIDILVSTGANLVHDFVEANGGKHYKGTWNTDDTELFSHKIDRIYDIFIPDEAFIKFFDNPMLNICDQIVADKNNLSIKDFIYEVGRRMKPCQDSIIYNAYKFNIPLYVPALSDSCFGLLWEPKYRKHLNGLKIDVMSDLEPLFQTFKKSKKRGAVVIGGGVPKNFIFQAAFITDKQLDYVVQITMDRPETGGLSGATLEEAVSWGKIKGNASKVQVISDATICLPILAAAVMERMRGKRL